MRLKWSVLAVSYTHLDVYKRQSLYIIFLQRCWVNVHLIFLLTGSVISYVLFWLFFVIVYGPVYSNSSFFVIPSIVLGNSRFFSNILSPTWYCIIFNGTLFWYFLLLWSIFSTILLWNWILLNWYSWLWGKLIMSLIRCV